jgi:hypothetical protein
MAVKIRLWHFCPEDRASSFSEMQIGIYDVTIQGVRKVWNQREF